MRVKSDSQMQDSFILALFHVPTLILAHALALIYFRNIERFDADRVCGISQRGKAAP
jgi:hypothetical protein